MDFKMFIAILVILLSIMYTQPNLLYNIIDNCLGKAVFLTIVLYLALQDIKLGFIAGILLIVAIQTRNRIENFVEGIEQPSLDDVTVKLYNEFAKSDAPSGSNEDTRRAFAKALAWKDEWKDIEQGTETETPPGTMFKFFGTNAGLPTLDQVKKHLTDEEYDLFYDKYKDTPLKWPDIQKEQSSIPTHTHKIDHVLSESTTGEGFSITSTDLLSNNEKIRPKNSNMYNVKRPGNS